MYISPTVVVFPTQYTGLQSSTIHDDPIQPHRIIIQKEKEKVKEKGKEKASNTHLDMAILALQTSLPGLGVATAHLAHGLHVTLYSVLGNKLDQ